MDGTPSLETRCRKILEDNGGIIAEKARAIFLKDSALKDLIPPFEFISKNWRDPLTPAMMRLSCEAVGGKPEETYIPALAMSLINLSFRLWDDMIDKTSIRSFKPTFYGKFKEDTTLIIGGLVTAKAFSFLSQANIEYKKRQTIHKLIWNFLTKMARAETINLRLRNQENPSTKDKFWKIKTEAADLETCMKIGAILGEGSQNEICQLGKYGLNLGIIMELWKDFHVSLNLTLELAEKIRSKALPYTVLWAKEHSERLQEILASSITKENEQIYIKQIVAAIIKAKTLNNTFETIKKLTENGKQVFTKMKRNTTTQTLQLFIEAQPRLFIESLPKIKGITH